jgi:ABC-type lipoprotein export system ATPase subunit
MEFNIKDVGVKSYEEWKQVCDQLFDVWVKLGKIEADRPPSMLGYDFFQHPHKEEEQIKIRGEWRKLTDWISRNGCRLQDNKKVTLWPRSSRSKKEVDPEAPYEDDALKRNEKVGSMLTQLINIQTDPQVIAINGAWGSGKTTLLNMWTPTAEKEFCIVHFNAWETDYAKDPLVALVAELKNSLGKTVPEEKMRDFLRVVANVTVKGLSAGLLSASDLSPEEMKASYQKVIEQQLAEYEGTKHLLENFRARLKDIAAELDQKPLVFVIDELDRCRPTYAIELLERMKHLFTVKGVCFVLALDKKQLSQAIKAVYGDIHTEGYLRRFIDLTYNLPDMSPIEYVHTLFREIHLGDYLDARSVNDGAAGWTRDMLCYLAPIFNFSLRDIEHVVRQISLAARSTSHNFLFSPMILAVLACIKHYDEELYQNFCLGKIGAGDVLASLPKLEKDDEGSNSHLCAQAALRYVDQTAQWDVWIHTLELKTGGSEPEKADRKDLAHITQSLHQWHNTSFHVSTKEVCEMVYEKLELLQPLVG